MSEPKATSVSFLGRIMHRLSEGLLSETDHLQDLARLAWGVLTLVDRSEIGRLKIPNRGQQKPAGRFELLSIRLGVPCGNYPTQVVSLATHKELRAAGLLRQGGETQEVHRLFVEDLAKEAPRREHPKGVLF